MDSMDRTVRGLPELRTPEAQLRPPPFGGRVVERPRLLAALNAGLDDGESFMMLNAPPGYGKTMLLAQWAGELADTEVTCAWCTVSEDDRDPLVLLVTLLDSLVLAAGDEHPGLSEKLGALHPSAEPLQHSEYLSRLSTVLRRHPGSIVVIVDDVDLLKDTDSERELIRFVQLMPTNVSIAISTRTPLHIHRARVEGRLIELTADSLSFTRAEADALFEEEPDIAAERVDALHAAAEGWPAALSLARLSVERQVTATAKFAALLDPLALQQYLGNEVYSDLTEKERRVIEVAAISSRVTAELIATVTGVSDGTEVMSALADRYRLLRRVSTDDRGRSWFELLPLFGDFVRERLVETDQERLGRLTQEAAQWHSDNGGPLLALELALRTNNPCLLDGVLRRRGYELVMDRRALVVLGALSTNDPRIAAPFARLMTAYAAVIAGDPQRANDLLEAARINDLSFDDLVEWDWLSYVVTLCIHLARREGTDTVWSGWPESTMTTLPDDLRLAIQLTRGLSSSLTRTPTAATQELQRARTLAENHNDLPRRVLSLIGLAGVASSQFHVHEVQSLCEHAIAVATGLPDDALCGPRSMAHSLASWAAAELLDSAGAIEHARLAVEHAAAQSDPEVAVLAAHAQTAATFSGMAQRRRFAQDFVTNWPPPYTRRSSDSTLVVALYLGLGMAASLGEFRWSERLLDRARAVLGENPDWQVAYALHLLQTGRDAAARTVVAPLLAAQEVRLPQSDIVLHSLDAVLESRASNPFRAHSAMYRALEKAEEYGAYLEVTRVGAQNIAPILASGLDRFGPYEGIARALLAGNVGGSTLDGGPLTERERQILGELRTLRTVDEIGHDILLSVNTVKTHMRSIYRKLGVTSRRQAIAKAEELGML